MWTETGKPGRFALLRLAGVCLVLLVWLSGSSKPQSRVIILATTTSTQDSGLLDELVPIFQRETGYRVKTIAVGSGQAMALGERGEADVLLVHSPEAEMAFVAAGRGINRRRVMHNDFVLVGPPSDPAGIMGLDAVAALRKIAQAKSLFLSRGDNSGTQARERTIWQAAGIQPDSQPWYQQTGQGMGQTLQVASHKEGYSLSDRGTFLVLKDKLGLAILCEGSHSLQNVYHVITVNPARFPTVQAAGARAFADFLLAPATQERIRGFGRDKFGQGLFVPAAAPGQATTQPPSATDSSIPGRPSWT